MKREGRLRNSLAVSLMVHLAVLSVTVVYGMGGTARMDMRNAMRVSLYGDSAIDNGDEEGFGSKAFPLLEVATKPDGQDVVIDKTVLTWGEQALISEHNPPISINVDDRNVDEVTLDGGGEVSALGVPTDRDGMDVGASALAAVLPIGSGDGGVESDSGRYDRVLALIKTAIQEAVRYPVLARKRGIEGTVIAEFYINDKGNAEGIKVIKSSGHGILDRETMRVIRRASPYPPLGGKVEVPVRFSLMEADG